jgi:aminodeoxychorismate synthase component I
MSIVPDRTEFLSTARAGWRVPVCLECPLFELTPVELYSRIRSGAYGFLLESGKDHRYSYAACEPFAVWRSTGDHCRIERDGAKAERGNPFDLLSREFSEERLIRNPLLRKFSGGAVGYFAYDMARQIERLPETTEDDLHLPESCFLFVDRFYEIDHEQNVLRIVFAPRITEEKSLEMQYDRILQVLSEMENRVRSGRESRKLEPPTTDERATNTSPINASASPEEFAEMVVRAKEYIRAGDIFQVNLSVRFDQRFDGDPLDLYRTLREINPSPYMSYFDLPEMAIVSASPELLLRVNERTIETRPIAGTRPRTADEGKNAAAARELIENEKERAEHIMLVDLERNDIGRVAKFGSVEVNELMAIENYSHVMHIVSNVRGQLADGMTTFDAIKACFPGGTITGAPKVRAMEIIDELERYRRGIYTGSIGWIGFDGDAELNIAIRTIVVKDGRAYVQAGAGIVADSIPEQEYRESVRKAEAALQAVRTTIKRSA